MARAEPFQLEHFLCLLMSLLDGLLIQSALYFFIIHRGELWCAQDSLQLFDEFFQIHIVASDCLVFFLADLDLLD